MSQASRVLGWFTQCEKALRDGLLDARVEQEGSRWDVDRALDQLFSSPTGHGHLRRIGFEFGRWLRILENDADFRPYSTAVEMKDVVVPVPGMRIKLGFGWIFTVQYVDDLEVDDSITPHELLVRDEREEDYEWLGGEFSSTGKRKVKALVGELNHPWSAQIMCELLAQPGCRFKGSGDWVREALMIARPKYDKKGWIWFPGNPLSRWKCKRGADVLSPALGKQFRSDDESWDRALDPITFETASARACLEWV